MSILVTGSTGTVGQHVVRSLVQQGAKKIRLLVRDENKARRLFADLPSTTEIQYAKGDVTNVKAATEAFTGVERLFNLTMSTPSQKYIEEALVKFAIESSPGLKQVVRLSVLGADLNHDQESLLRWHAESERAVGTVLEEKDVAYTIIRPNLFLQNFLRDDTYPIKNHGTFSRMGAPDCADYKLSHVDVRDIGEAIGAVLTQDVAKNASKTFNISGPQALDYNQVADIVANVIGKPVNFVPLDDVTYYKSLVEAGLSEPYAFTLVKLYQYYKTSSSTAVVYGDFEILTGKKSRSVEKFFEDFRTAFQ